VETADKCKKDHARGECVMVVIALATYNSLLLVQR